LAASQRPTVNIHTLAEGIYPKKAQAHLHHLGMAKGLGVSESFLT
jgi:hypothetical protein